MWTASLPHGLWRQGILRVVAELASDTVPSGEKTLVDCIAEDANGNIISDLTYTITGDETGLAITGMEIVGVIAGEYEIGCVVDGFETIESTPDFLTVTAGAAVEIELFVDPDQTGYKPGTDVTFSWVVRDSKGNELESPDVTLAAPATGVNWFLVTRTSSSTTEPTHSPPSLPMDKEVRLQRASSTWMQMPLSWWLPTQQED